MKKSLSIKERREVARLVRETLPEHRCAKYRGLNEALVISSIIKLVKNKGKKYDRQERRSIKSYIESCSPNGGRLLTTSF